MNPILLQTLTMIACFLAGALAGINMDGFIVRFPAWRRLGAGPRARTVQREER